MKLIILEIQMLEHFYFFNMDGICMLKTFHETKIKKKKKESQYFKDKCKQNKGLPHRHPSETVMLYNFLGLEYQGRRFLLSFK